MSYETFTVYRRADDAAVGSVAAQSRAEAIFRLAGGTFGRDDYYAHSEADHRALASAVMTEAQVERVAERKMDALDRRLMAGELSQLDYDSAVRRLDDWARNQARG